MKRTFSEEHKQKISLTLKAKYAGRTEKKCPKCSETKPIDQFGRRTNGVAQSYCIPCLRVDAAERNRRYRERNAHNREKMAEANRRTKLKLNFGITPEIYQEMLSAQGHTCAICKTTEQRGRKRHFSVDHDHRTGKVRGLLCDNCNRAIGLLADDASIIQAAAAYLIRTSPAISRT